MSLTISKWKELVNYLLRPLVYRIVTTALSIIVCIILSCTYLVFGLTFEQQQVVATTALMILLWIFQSIPLAVTSLLPLFLYPLFGIMSGAAVSKEYVNQTSMIFIGGFIFALAIERWRLHERIALFILSKVGSRLHIVLLGSMSIAYIMSMWLSNTATCLILMPNCAAICAQLKSQYSKKTPDSVFAGLEVGLFLGIAFACNIGGITTPIGTPPNLLFAQQYEVLFPGKVAPNFLQWIALAGPISLLFVVVLYAYMYFFYVRKTTKLLKSEEKISTINKVNQDQAIITTPDEISNTNAICIDMNDITSRNRIESPQESDSLKDVFELSKDQIASSQDSEETTDYFESFKEQYKKFGKMTYEEWVVAILFTILVILWSTRVAWQQIPIFKKDYINDGMIAIGMGFLLFIIPAKNQDPLLNGGDFVSIMDWSVMSKFPWDIIFLFGAGFSISAAFSNTQLTQVIAQNLAIAKNWHPIFMILISCTVVTFCTEVITNIATIIVFLPILAAFTKASGSYNPLLVLIPATISSSYAFMLPIGTAPNMIAFKAAKTVTIKRMMIAGIWLNLFAICLTTLLSYALIPLIYGYNP